MKELTNCCSFHGSRFSVEVDLSVPIVDGDRLDRGAKQPHQTQILSAHLRARDLDVKAAHGELDMHVGLTTACLKVDVLLEDNPCPPGCEVRCCAQFGQYRPINVGDVRPKLSNEPVGTTEGLGATSRVPRSSNHVRVGHKPTGMSGLEPLSAELLCTPAEGRLPLLRRHWRIIAKEPLLLDLRVTNHFRSSRFVNISQRPNAEKQRAEKAEKASVSISAYRASLKNGVIAPCGLKVVLWEAIEPSIVCGFSKPPLHAFLGELDEVSSATCRKQAVSFARRRVQNGRPQGCRAYIQGCDVYPGTAGHQDASTTAGTCAGLVFPRATYACRDIYSTRASSQEEQAV